MKTNFKLVQHAAGFVLLISIIAGSSIVSSANPQRRRRPVRRTPVVPTYVVPANEIFRVRLNETLSSRTARIGDRFSANVAEPVYASGGTMVVPVGSKVWGRVASVRRAGRRTPGQITVSFYSLGLPNGRSYPINGSLTTLEADDVRADNEGTVAGRSNRKRDAVFIGGGAATGAIIGAIAGGGKGAAIGAIIGGGLGTGARVYEKEQEANVKSGTEFGVILNRSVRLPRAS